MSKLNQQFTLPGGRKLGYAEHGEASGKPLFYFHGTPSARVEWGFFGSAELVRKLGLHVIAVDRPGMGLSSFQPDRRMSDWPSDVAALASKLGLDRFAVLGFSGGTPYALACALKIPERLISVGLVGVEAPFELPGMTAGLNSQSLQFLEMNRDKPWLARIIQTTMGLSARFAPDRLLAQVMNALPEPDRAVLASADKRQAFVKMMLESTRGGTRGPQVDTALMVSPWGFDPADIKMQVQIWQGELDADAPPSMARYIAGAIPQSQITFYPTEGHLSVMVNHVEEILAALTGIG